MRKLTLSLDALPTLSDAMDARCDLTAAAKLAELAGISAVRLGIHEELRPVRERDVMSLRGASPVFELRMTPAQNLLKLALEARPDLVVLSAEGWEGGGRTSPIDPRSRTTALAPLIRALEEARIPTATLISPDLESVKAAHGLGVAAVELFTTLTVDLPPSERRPELERLGDCARLASKLHLSVGVAGGLDYRTVSEVLEAAPVTDRVVVGRALIARSLLVGIDRAARDFLALVG
jgi:pyridoxine 5-phosphate synthase